MIVAIPVVEVTNLNFYNFLFRDCIIFAFVNTGTSLICGVIIFSVLGFIAVKDGASVDQALTHGRSIIIQECAHHE